MSKEEQRKSILRRVIDSQIWLSKSFDKLLPEDFVCDGNRDFQHNIAPRFILDNQTVYDVGGGSQPYIKIDEKLQKNITIAGLDICQDELDAAPMGVYDKKICADLTSYTGDSEADLVICQATMEHVKNSEGAIAAMASILKPGGRALLFMPSRNAVFARLNLILPESWKKKILFTLFPHKAEGHDGFPAYYDRCTPKEYRLIAEKLGFEVEELHTYYISSYFSICAPVYVLWRMWMILFKMICGKQAAETFALVLKKKD